MEINNSTENKLNSPFSMVDFLLYFGGFSFFLGIYYLVLTSWNSLGVVLQILLTLGVSLALLIGGTFLIKNYGLRKLGLPLIFISIFLLPIGLTNLLDKIFTYQNTNEFLFISTLISLFCASLLFVTNLYVNSSMVLFFVLLYFQSFYYFFITNFSQKYDVYFFSDIHFFGLVIFGLSGLILSRYFINKNKFFYYLLSFFSTNYLFIGIWFFEFFLNKSIDAEPYRLVFFPIFVLSVLYFGVKLKETIIKVFSIIYLIFFLLYLFVRYMRYEYFVSTLLIVLGLSLVIFGFYYYLKDSTKNSNNQL